MKYDISVSYFFSNLLKDTKGIKRTLMILTIVSILSMFWSSTFLSYSASKELTNNATNAYKKSLINNKKESIKNDSDFVIEIINTEYNKYKTGIMPESSAQKSVQTILSDLQTSNSSDGFWVESITNNTLIYSSISNEQQLTNRDSLTDKNNIKYIFNIKKSLENKDSAYNEFSLLKDDNKTVSPCITYSVKFKPWNWVITSRAFLDTTNADIDQNAKTLTSIRNKKFINVYIVGSIIAIILLIFSGLVGMNIVYNISRLVNNIRTMEQGDFTSRLSIKTNNELKTAGDALNTAQNKITSLIHSINTIANDVNDSVNTFKDTQEKMNNSINTVSDSVISITKNINDQASATSEVSKNIDDISESIVHTSNEVSMLENNSSTMMNYSNKSLSSLTKLLDINNKTQKSIDEMYKHTSLTNDSVENISKAAALINDISTQTNLLSLNASIEAARAGEHGKGFSVVASEIGGLATQSSNTVKEINSILDNLTSNFNKSMEIMKDMSVTSAIQSETLKNTSKDFNELANVLDICAKSINNITKMINEINNKKENIIYNIDKLNSFASNNAAYTEETSAMTEELTDMVSLSNNEINLLSNGFNELVDNLNFFKY